MPFLRRRTRRLLASLLSVPSSSPKRGSRAPQPISNSSLIPLYCCLSSTEKLKFEPKIDAIVSSLSIKRFESDLRYLTGEDKKSECDAVFLSFSFSYIYPSLVCIPLPGPILSRHSFSSTARLAARHIKDLVESTGASCSLAPFLTGFTPNVICEYPYLGKGPERHVIFSAHYDSRGSFGSTRAPGGDDDGSGTTQLLGIAQSIKEAGITGFKEKVSKLSCLSGPYTDAHLFRSSSRSSPARSRASLDRGPTPVRSRIPSTSLKDEADTSL